MPLDSDYPIAFESEINQEDGYGEVTQFLFIDTEFDQQVPCRITIINESGQIVIDTLVRQDQYIAQRQSFIHGITDFMLRDAPSLESVVAHILQICHSRSTVLVAHGGKQDLKCLSLYNCQYIDTQNYYDKGGPKSLKDLSGIVLNARIQYDVHSSIIDARMCLGLFLHNGKSRQFQTFMTMETLYSSSTARKQKNKKQRTGTKEKGPEESKSENLISMGGVSERQKQLVHSLGISKRFQGVIDDNKIYRVNLKEIQLIIEQEVSMMFNHLKHFK